MIKVFKFGGASVKDAESVRNVSDIIKNHAPENLVVVISAMGKTTNALEKAVNAWYHKKTTLSQIIDELICFHENIVHNLFTSSSFSVFEKTSSVYSFLRKLNVSEPPENYNYAYDQIVSAGELLSSLIMSEYLILKGFNCKFFDVSALIRTDETWREGNVDWDITVKQINQKVLPVFNASAQKPCIVLTQGFLGGTASGERTTLGREGSDYTAAIFSFALHAAEMTVWKDVQGVLNADPKHFEHTHLLQHISYKEAIELTYYGATVIHPKTIKPLQNKNIPLRVRSFINPQTEGTTISEYSEDEPKEPSVILKLNQVLLSFSPKDFSFIVEDNLSEIFSALAKTNIRANMMQNSAITFTVCIDEDPAKMNKLLELLNKHFIYKYNSGLQLITIRNYASNIIDLVVKNRDILVEQRSRLTAQFVVKG